MSSNVDIFETFDWMPSKPVVPRIIADYIQTKARYKFNWAGRRSFKTEGGFRDDYEFAMLNRNKRMILAAPTQEQATNIFWDKVLKHFAPFIAKKNYSKSIVDLYNGTRIEVRGLDRPERIEGSYLHRLHVAESPDVKPKAWEEHILPTLSDAFFEGEACFDGTPDHRNPYWRDMIEQFCCPDGRVPPTHPINGVKVSKNDAVGFSWHSGILLPPKEVQAAKERMDELTFRQEYQGEFVDVGGVVYYSYSHDNYSDVTYDPNRKTVVTFDFNINPMSVCIAQEIDTDKWVFVKEFSLRNANTDQTCDIVLEYLLQQVGQVIITGDFAGTQRSTSASVGSLSDWAIIERKLSVLPRMQKKIRPTLSIKDRVASINAMFCNAEGLKRLHVNRSECPVLHNDLTKQAWTKDGRLDDQSGRLGHMSDAASYFTYNLYAIERNKPIYR